MRRLLVGSLVVVLSAGVAAAALAQQGVSDIGGKVTDQQGGALPGVTLVFTNEDTGIVREVTTTADGSYFVAQLIPGRYRINAQLEGFKTLDRRGVTTTVGVTTSLDLTLEVGGVAETVTVSAEATLIDTTSAEIGGHISAAELAELPAGVRSYMAFVGTVPGAIFVPATGFLNETMAANGQPQAANNVSMDGATNVDDLRGTGPGGQARVPNEALQEVQVITNQFDAEYGRASGAVINAVTKSGTNLFSGAAFAFFTDRSVIAKDYFARVNKLPKPEVGKDEWGGTIGGPVLRNKLFFFATLERIIQNRNQRGTFPSRPEFNFSNASEESAWTTMWRIDHQLNPSHTWAFRWLRELGPQFNRARTGRDTRGSDGDETDLDETLVGTLTSVVSNTKVNTVRYGLTRERTVHANALWRALDPGYARCVSCGPNAGDGQVTLPPRLDYLSLLINPVTMDYSLDDAHSLENTFSWFIPDKVGRHDTKFGAKYTHIWISNPNWANMNGTYVFGHDLAFNAADPRTYPERLRIRVPGPLEYEMISHTYELYAQDKWQVTPGLTFSLGVRYDLEVTPIDEADNPLFRDPTRYPVDRNNLAPRLGVIWNPDGEGRSVVRGGYGIFYDRTQLQAIDDILFATKYSRSFTADFPQDNPDTSWARGQFPAEAVLNTPSVTELTPAVRAYINSLYPPGSVRRNNGEVYFDDPDRKQPKFHQTSIGYERELLPGVSASADYIHMVGRDMFLNPNLNIVHRLNTSRTGPIQRLDPFGVLNRSLAPGEGPYLGAVSLRTTKYGYTYYDALNVSVEKRYANNWNIRGAYSLGYSRGTASGQNDIPLFQVGSNLNLKAFEAPQNTDRRHTAAISGRMEIPKTGGVSVSGTLRLLSGQPFTIHDTTFDLDQNGIPVDPLPAGTYNPFPEAGEHVLKNVKNKGGRNGAVGPGFQQLDLRFGYRLRVGGRRTFDVFSEVFNATNHANFTNGPSPAGTNNTPSMGDMRNRANFLRLTELVAVTGLPRQFQLGLRLGF